MKKNITIVISALIVIFLLLFILLNTKKNIYTVKVTPVDRNTPDVTLSVYENDRMIEIEDIYYMNDVLLCHGSNPTTNKFNIKNNDELKIILKNKKEVIAKVLMEE